MELTTSLRRQNVPRQPSTPCIALTQERRTEITTRYGDTLEAFMRRMNPDTQAYAAEHPDRALFGNAPTLWEINQVYGNRSASKWLVPQLYDLSEYCGCKEKLTERMYVDCAQRIAKRYRWLKTSELLLFFDRFKLGDYGRFYGSIDPQIIMEALPKFIQQRAAAIERHDREERERQAEEHRRKYPPVPYEEYCRRHGLPIAENPIMALTARKDTP